MDVDGKQGEEQADNRAPGNQLPASGQHNAASSAAQQEGAGAGFMAHQSKPVKAGNKPVVVLSQNGVSANGIGQWNATLMTPQNDSGLLNKTKEQIGGTVSPGRSSKRNAPTVDQDSLEKATKLKARKNLDYAPDKGNELQSCSFISRNDSSLLDTAKSLGVVLGDNEQAVLDSL
jgi:hypothetical protein